LFDFPAVKTSGLRALLAPLFLAATILTAQADPGWLSDFKKAQAEAKASKKLLLLDFTGSDWCHWCIKLDKEILSQPKFKEYAAKNLVLMTVDFPHAKPQTPEVKKQNEQLFEQWGIQGFPTIIVLNGEGKKVGELGYMEGGPSAFVAELEKLPKS
jgi:thioredoxin-related protein